MLCELTDGQKYLCDCTVSQAKLVPPTNLEEQTVLSIEAVLSLQMLSETRLVDLANQRLNPKYYQFLLKVLQEENNPQNWM